VDIRVSGIVPLSLACSNTLLFLNTLSSSPLLSTFSPSFTYFGLDGRFVSGVFEDVELQHRHLVLVLEEAADHQGLLGVVRVRVREWHVCDVQRNVVACLLGN
jgi:hypothetical protein